MPVRMRFDFLYESGDGLQKIPIVLEDVATVAADRPRWHRQNIGTTAEAINLGTVAAPRWAVFINRDATNYVEIFTSNGGVIFCKLLAGEGCLIPLGSGVTAPYARANTAAIELEYAIIDT
jgi:hypothetical protein